MLTRKSEENQVETFDEVIAAEVLDAEKLIKLKSEIDLIIGETEKLRELIEEAELNSSRIKQRDREIETIKLGFETFKGMMTESGPVKKRMFDELLDEVGYQTRCRIQDAEALPEQRNLKGFSAPDTENVRVGSIVFAALYDEVLRLRDSYNKHIELGQKRNRGASGYVDKHVGRKVCLAYWYAFSEIPSSSRSTPTLFDRLCNFVETSLYKNGVTVSIGRSTGPEMIAELKEALGLNQDDQYTQEPTR